MKTKSFIIPFLLFQALLFTGSNLLYAIPARPGVITVTQSDGTVSKYAFMEMNITITLYLKKAIR